MEKKRVYYIIILLLLFTNGVLLAIILKTKPENRRGRHPEEVGGAGPRNLIIERLHFDEAQVLAYEDLIRWHRKNIKERNQAIRSLKKEMYQSLNADSTTTDSLIREIITYQTEIEKIHVQHFKDIEKLCKGKQKEYFQDLQHDLAGLFH